VRDAEENMAVTLRATAMTGEKYRDCDALEKERNQVVGGHYNPLVRDQGQVRHCPSSRNPRVSVKCLTRHKVSVTSEGSEMLFWVKRAPPMSWCAISSRSVELGASCR
jgi:hypothetical protein